MPIEVFTGSFVLLLGCVFYEQLGAKSQIHN